MWRWLVEFVRVVFALRCVECVVVCMCVDVACVCPVVLNSSEVDSCVSSLVMWWCMRVYFCIVLSALVMLWCIVSCRVVCVVLMCCCVYCFVKMMRCIGVLVRAIVGCVVCVLGVCVFCGVALLCMLCVLLRGLYVVCWRASRLVMCSVCCVL